MICTRRKSLRDDVEEDADLARMIARRAEELEIAGCMSFRIFETGQPQELHGA